MEDTLDLETINAELEVATPEAILHWAWTQFAPAIAATSSFQTQSLPLLHMIACTTPEAGCQRTRSCVRR
jgi:3'-phosphoadenosine 5'-phosphosulfate sulfotransferase (PAPS reductase)/FAD synthetase